MRAVADSLMMADYIVGTVPRTQVVAPLTTSNGPMQVSLTLGMLAITPRVMASSRDGPTPRTGDRCEIVGTGGSAQVVDLHVLDIRR